MSELALQKGLSLSVGSYKIPNLRSMWVAP